MLGPAAEPFATPLGDVAVALMAGNGVVLKPSPHACLAGERIARVFARAGLPDGLLRVVHGHADAGSRSSRRRVAQVRFTGSARAGRAVGEACARGVKRSVLEIGGKDAMLVFADADLERAARGVVWARVRRTRASAAAASSARSCCARSHDDFLAAVVGRARARCASATRADPTTDVGPLVTRERAARVRELVDEAVAAGATAALRRPGRRVPGLAPPAAFAPAVLTGVRDDMRIAREDVPARCSSSRPSPDEDEAIAAANEPTLGLGASVWTADRYKGAAHRARAAGRHGLGQRPPRRRAAPRRSRGAACGGSGIGPRARRHRAAHLRRAEGRDLGPAGRPPGLVVPLRRRAGPRGRGVAGLRSARDADRERAWREDALPIARVTGRWLRGLRAGR